jgi:hypothetical protein
LHLSLYFTQNSRLVYEKILSNPIGKSSDFLKSLVRIKRSEIQKKKFMIFPHFYFHTRKAHLKTLKQIKKRILLFHSKRKEDVLIILSIKKSMYK